MIRPESLLDKKSFLEKGGMFQASRDAQVGERKREPLFSNNETLSRERRLLDDYVVDVEVSLDK